jgi:NADPH:quinone reductase-like Zn-dependent oxidoreductase
VVHAIDLLGSDNVTRSALAEAMVLVREGKIDAVIDRRLDLSEAAEAHRLLEAREAFGRILLVPSARGGG